MLYVWLGYVSVFIKSILETVLFVSSDDTRFNLKTEMSRSR